MLKLYFFEVLFHFYSLFFSCSLGITDCFIYTHIKTYQITKYNILWSLLHCCCKLFEHLKMFYKSESKKDRHALIKYIYSRGFFALCVAVVGFVIFFYQIVKYVCRITFFCYICWMLLTIFWFEVRWKYEKFNQNRFEAGTRDWVPRLDVFL